MQCHVSMFGSSVMIAMAMPISTIRARMCVPGGDTVECQYMERPCPCMNDIFIAGQGGHSGSIELRQCIGHRAVRTRDLKQESALNL